MHPKDADGMENSVDPYQTAFGNSLNLICTVYLDLSVPILRIFMVPVLQLGSEQNRVTMPEKGTSSHKAPRWERMGDSPPSLAGSAPSLAWGVGACKP